MLVCGAGPAGVSAAIAAAREGARTVLLERYGMAGGMWTAGLVNPFFEATRNGWLVRELIQRLEAAGAWKRWKFAHTFCPETMKLELERMLAEAGVELLYHTYCVDSIVQDGRLRGVITESKAGREAVLAKVTVDCTGDGDIAARAGCEYEMGRDADGVVQPMTLMFEVRGIGSFDCDSALELFDLMSDALERAGLPHRLPFERVNYAPWLITLPAAGEAAIQATHVYRLNPLDPADLTKGTVDARRQAHEMVEVLRHVPGLEGVRLAATAPQMGIRETRRVTGLYRLTLADLTAPRAFEDGIASCGFGVDIHDPDPDSGVDSGHGVKTGVYDIPYRCLVPAGVGGLLVAGRCISGSHEAHASYRVTGTCMAMGQAAGLAAAWCVRDGMEPAEVDGGELRRVIASRKGE
ncbi:MAG: FAD-dependent oxidoreductase [Armatimonadetes bacterium]|nr:FAD-dependent oxidoreductase [Armatimonadota bacterium]